MIPTFPNFKKLDFEDKEEIEKFYDGNIIPSDYHFASLWAWDLNNETEISKLNNNLVVKLKDYQTSENIYSFSGSNLIENTIEVLLSYLEQSGEKLKINLVPEHNFVDLKLQEISNKYHIEEDENNFDYIFSVDDLLQYDKKELYTKRKQLKKFITNYLDKTTTVIFESIDPTTHKDIIELLEGWSKIKISKQDVNNIEVNALKRTLLSIPKIKFFVFCIYISKKLAGFSIYEIIDKNHAIHSFQKANLSYIGITEFMNQKISEHLKSFNIKYINAEQDLGIEGLRRAKKAYNPTYIKKFTISRKKLTN